jgi:gliding motility-associated-like protein
MTLIALSAQAQEATGDDSLTSDSTVVLTSSLVIPNAFSPNHDEINEVFKVKSYQNIVEFHAYIFNRWGQKLYEWTDLEGGWDGTYQGKDVKQGTYFVLVKAKGADGQTYNIRKDVNLLRGFTEGTSISQ